MNMDVDHIMRLARLSLGEDEKAEFGRQLGGILDYVEKLNKLDTTDIEPTSHVLGMRNVMKEDIVKPSLETNDALMNAPDSADGFYRVPKIIE